MIRIAIVDDRSLNRQALADEIVRQGDFQVLFTASNGEEFLAEMKRLPRESHPHAVTMDIDMPVKDGIQTVLEAKAIYPETEFLMLTVFDEDDKIFAAIQAGASGYLLKDESARSIAQHVQQVVEFKSVPMSPGVARKALKWLSRLPKPEAAQSVESGLTAREEAVLKGIVEGLDYKEIAERHFVSPNTVRNQIAKIYEKLHVSSRVEAVKLAIRKGIA